MPGTNLKIINKNKEFFLTSIFLIDFFIRCLKFFANINERVDPMVKDIIEINEPMYPNIKVDSIRIGEAIPIKATQIIDNKK